MGIINLLDFKVANLIAAGEVVDRPASVIKELMENSIDAGASNITVEIKNGGISSMRVTDNGKGMISEDVPICIKRHATSKIKDEKDLDGILTLGFRGEALAAIASVCKLKIITKPADREMGTMLESENGEISGIVEIGCQNGTTVICEELFGNVPARRKFLKSNMAETAAITAAVEKAALSRPDMVFKYIIDGDEKYTTQGDGKLINTIYSVLGKDFAKKLISVKSITEGIEVTGYICSPDSARGSRNNQIFYINERFIKSKTIMAALEQAFDSFIAADKFPSCVLNIKIHPAYVDVNVHPTKLEVKFSNEKVVFNAVYCAVRNALTNKIKPPELQIPGAVKTQTAADAGLINAFTQIDDGLWSGMSMDITRNQKPEPKHEIKEVSRTPDIAYEDLIPPYFMPENNDFKENQSQIMTDIKADEVEKKSEKTESEVKDRSITDKIEFSIPKYKIAGEVFFSYIIVELQDKILLIDKHAAHERIIFETMKTYKSKGGAVSQVLLVPVEIKLNAPELAAVCEYDADIKAIGFDYEINENQTDNNFKIFQIPSNIETSAAADVMLEMAEKLAEGLSNAGLTGEIIYEKALYQASCKAAIKAGHNENINHLMWICDQLLSIPNIKYCPHGRPVAFELTKREIERQFKRI